jgi:hypothetical protein
MTPRLIVLLTLIMFVSRVCVAFATRPVAQPTPPADDQQLQLQSLQMDMVRVRSTKDSHTYLVCHFRASGTVL